MGVSASSAIHSATIFRWALNFLFSRQHCGDIACFNTSFCTKKFIWINCHSTYFIMQACRWSFTAIFQVVSMILIRKACECLKISLLSKAWNMTSCTFWLLGSLYNTILLLCAHAQSDTHHIRLLHTHGYVASLHSIILINNRTITRISLDSYRSMALQFTLESCVILYRLAKGCMSLSVVTALWPHPLTILLLLPSYAQ